MVERSYKTSILILCAIKIEICCYVNRAEDWDWRPIAPLISAIFDFTFLKADWLEFLLQIYMELTNLGGVCNVAWFRFSSNGRRKHESFD